MKIFVVSLLCALAGRVAASVQAWGSPQVYLSSVVRAEPAQVKGFAYSSSQFINSAPSAAYSFGLQPQFAYQVPTLSGIGPFHSAYYPVASPSIYPSGVFLATVPAAAPAIPAAPAGPTAPPAPEVPNQSDSDTTVVESADRTQDSSSSSAPMQSGQPSPPNSAFPSFPSIPQIPQLQESPQGSQTSFPQFPQAPADADYSQGPGSAPPSFLGGNGSDKGLNDEDTISVESA